MSISRSEAMQRVGTEGGLPDELWESCHVMVYQRWCYTKLKNNIRCNGFPVHKNGRNNLFRRSEVEKWNESHIFLR